MKLLFTILILVVCFSGFSQTNFAVVTNSPGTRMSIIPTTTALARKLLLSEDWTTFIHSLGITNDNTGYLYSTNFDTNSAPVGRYIGHIFTADANLLSISQTTNFDGSIITTLGVLPLTTVSEVISGSPTLMGVTSVTNANKSVVKTITLSNTQPAIEEGYVITPSYSTVNGSSTNDYYWLDLGKITTFGRHYIYATIVPIPNDGVYFLGVTNGFKWGLLSVNVVASGNQTVGVPDAWPHYNLNGGWVDTNSYYQLTLSNNSEFRLTVQSNSTLSTTWAIFGQ